MVVHLLAIVTLATALCFPRIKALWISACLGLFFDLMYLSTPLGFFLFLCPCMTLLMHQATPHIPINKSQIMLPVIFTFFFLFSFLECTILGFFAHPFEDFLLGPAIDTLVFLFLRIISLKISPFFGFLPPLLFIGKKERFFSQKNPFFRKVSVEEIKKLKSSFFIPNTNQLSSQRAGQEENL